MEDYTGVTAMLVAMAPIYYGMWKSFKKQEQATTGISQINDAVNNKHPDHPRLADNVLELKEQANRQGALLELHTEELVSQSKQINRVEDCCHRTNDYLDRLMKTCPLAVDNGGTHTVDKKTKKGK